jgi:hypothetical protein
MSMEAEEQQQHRHHYLMELEHSAEEPLVRFHP